MTTNKSSDEALQMGLRSNLVSLQEFPKRMLLQDIRKQNCIHDGVFCFTDAECWGCNLRDECLYIISKFDELDKTNNHERLIKCIKSSRNYVIDKVSKQHHGARTCFCDACKWLRETESTLSLLNSNK